MKLKDLIEQYGEYDVEEWFEIGTDGVADEKGIMLKKPEPKTVWDLKNNDEYYYIDADGYVNISTYAEIESEENGVSVGNTFLTEEEAEKDVERRKVEALLLKHGGRRYFDGHNHNFHIGLDEYEEHLNVHILMTPTQGTIYFDTRARAEKAISEIGEKRIIKALFEVR